MTSSPISSGACLGSVGTPSTTCSEICTIRDALLLFKVDSTNDALMEKIGSPINRDRAKYLEVLSDAGILDRYPVAVVNMAIYAFCSSSCLGFLNRIAAFRCWVSIQVSIENSQRYIPSRRTKFDLSHSRKMARQSGCPGLAGTRRKHPSRKR